MDEIFQKAQIALWPHVLQLVNTNLAKYVNTGDRAQDMIVTAVCHGAVLVLTSFLYFLCTKIWARLNVYNDDDMQKPINTAEVLKQYSLDMISSFKHVFDVKDQDSNVRSFSKPILVKTGDILKWVVDNEIVDTIDTRKDDKIEYIFDWSECIKPDTKTISSIQMPVYRYKNDVGKISYIFLHNNKLYSESSKELENLLKTVYRSMKPPVKTVKTYGVDTLNAHNGPSFRGYVPNIVSFERLYFTEKPKILNILSDYKNGTLFPPDLCVSHKLGVLFYGPPGTGKTKCVCAMANLLGRSILLVTKRTLESKESMRVMFASYSQTHIILFDEIDLLLKDIFAKPESPNKSAQNIFVIGNSDNGSKKETSTEDGPVDLDFLLELFDGVVDDTGLIMVATSNDLSSIPKALLRFGRFHFKYKLSFCTFQMFVDISRPIVPDIDALLISDPTLESRITNLLERNVSPTVLIAICVQYKNLESILHHISLLEPKQDYVDYEE